MYLHNLVSCVFFALILVFVQEALGKKGDKRPCPDEHAVVCISCSCDPENGYNTCAEAEDGCPPPIESLAELKKKGGGGGGGKCPNGKTFSAECFLCECSGEGFDRCSFCFVLPAKSGSQSAEVNRMLPQPVDNRFFNYVINGWDAPREESEENDD